MIQSDVEVVVCQYHNCCDRGAAAVLANFLAHPVPGVTITASGCQGQCNMGVTVRVLPDEVWYCRIQPEQVETIIVEHLQQGKPVQALLHPRFHPRFY